MEQEEVPTDKSSIGARVREGSGLLPLALLVLASIEPFLAFYDRNIDGYIQGGILLQLAAGTLMVVGSLYVLVLVALPRLEPVRVASAMAALVFCFFRYEPFNRDPTRSALMTVGFWALVAVVLVGFIAVWSRRSELRLFLLLYLAVSAATPLVSIAISKVGQDATVGPDASPLERLAVSDETVRTPDIWWLMMDQYGRADTLENIHGLDNAPFLEELIKRDFRVSDESYTSYPVTPLALSSLLQLDYITDDDTGLGISMYSFISPMRGGGRVVDALREHGYRYLYADNGVYDWGECDPGLADECIPAAPNGFSVGHLTRTISELTPLVELLPMNRIDIQWTVGKTMELMDPEKPEFAFIHTLSPHEPYWFNENCDFRSKAIEGDFDANRYVHQIRCLNPRILDVIDSITSADPEAIIILQSDHGPATNSALVTPYEKWSESDLFDRYAILEAMRMPETCETPQGVHSNVSTFEFVLACLEGRRPTPMPDRYFFWHWEDMNSLVEIDRPTLESEN